MKVLDLRLSEVRKVRNGKHLKGLPLIGRGAFSAVYDKGDTVMKLTTDPVTYALLSDSELSRSKHFPTVIKRHGIVGKQGDVFLYLIELEKLEPIWEYCEEFDSVYGLLERFESTTTNFKIEGKEWSAADSKKWLERECNIGGYTRSLKRAMAKLGMFVEKFEASLDLHAGNLMVRPGSKAAVVFSDPVFNTQLYDRFSN